MVCRLVVDTGAAPGGVVALGARDESGFRTAVGAAGRLSRRAGSPAVTAHTPYDLASVTKPVIAATAARLERAGVLSLAAPLGTLLPLARGTASEACTLELLLAHRAGLAAHLPLFGPLVARRPVERGRALRAACEARRPECAGDPPADGFPPLYSDLGYVLVGEAIARVAGAPLDELVAREVAGPLALELGSARQWRGRDPLRFAGVAPTETLAFRGGPVIGAVHDENAWALAGHGCAGQAGLFGTAASVCDFGCALLDALAGRRSDWLRRAEVERLVRPRPGGSLRAGFDGKSGEASAAGLRAGPRTFGHLGFTGTSLWCEPELQVVSVLLTNRVCPSRDDLRLRAARPKLQDALLALAAAARETQR